MNCGFEGCTRKKIYKTYCSGHNKQFNKGQTLRPLLDRAPVRKDANGKECRGCTTYKPYEEFHNSSRAKDGKQVNCKECQKAQKKQRQKTGTAEG